MHVLHPFLSWDVVSFFCLLLILFGSSAIYWLAHLKQQNNANNPAAIQGPTYESNIPIVQESSGSGFGNSECYGGSKDIKFMDQIIMVRGECTTAATTKADIELLAKNRGNAMLRYKEKKKTRRYKVFSYASLIFPFLFLFLIFILAVISNRRYKFYSERVNMLWIDMINISGTNQGRQELILGSE